MTKSTAEAIAGAAFSLLLPIGTGTVFGWATWVTVLMVVGMLVATAVVVLRRRPLHIRQTVLAEQWRVEQERAEQQAPAPEPHPAPDPPATTTMTSVHLPSSVPEIPFTFGCTVHWVAREHHSASGHADPSALALQTVVARARRVTEAHHPEDSGAMHALAAALGHPTPDSTNVITVWATSVRLTVGEEHRDHLRELSLLRRQRHLETLRMDNERMLRSYLSAEVLTSVGSTVVWWLAQDRTRVRETVDLIGTLAQLSAAANDADVDRVFQHLVPEHLRPALASHHARQDPLDDTSAGSPAQAVFVVNGSGVAARPAEPGNGADGLLPDPNDEHNTLFGHDLAHLLDRHDHPDRADEVRHRYGATEWPMENGHRDDPDPR